MAELGRITANNHGVFSLSTDPTVVGVPAEEGSIAFMDDGGTGRLFLKEGAADTAWRDIVASGGSFGLVASATASNSASIEFTTGIDAIDTAYVVYGSSVVPVTDGGVLLLQVSQDGGSTYKTAGGDYQNGQGSVTTAIDITKNGVGNAAGENVSFVTTMYNPANTVDYKNFSTQVCAINAAGGISNSDANAGVYDADTNAYNAIRFQFDVGNINSGLFQLFKISTETAGGSGSSLTGSVSTTDATVTDILTIGTTTNSTKRVDVDVTGRRIGGAGGAAGDSGAWKRTLVIKNIAGTVTIEVIQNAYTFKDQSAWDVTEAVSGTDVIIKVTGAASNNISWVTDAEIDTI